MDTALGVLLVAVAGLTMGSGIWPMKLMRKFQFEHWWFIGMLTGLILVPWGITLVAFPHAMQAYCDVPVSVLVKSNLFAMSWGIANVLCALCFVRIGVALTSAILTGLGVSVAAIMPMIFKGSGLFKDAPDVTSPAGLTVVGGVGVMLIGVVLASLAGFGRDRELKKLQQRSGSFLGGLIMTIIAGITSAGIMLAFVYSQGPIVARISIVEPGKTIKLAVADNKTLSGDYRVAEDGTVTLKGERAAPITIAGLTAKAAADRIAGILGLSQEPEAEAKVRVETPNILAVFAVWAVGLLAGAVINIVYPMHLMTKNHSWSVLTTSFWEVLLSLIIGFQFIVAVALVGTGMILLGALGASVGAGIQQAMQMVGGQGLGFISGEWRGVHGTPRRLMYSAIAMLIVAAVIMAYSNTLK
jgi:hypothetical protein